MKQLIALLMLASPLLMSCAYNRPYAPAKGPEQVENKEALLDVYPDDVRTNLNQFTNTLVAWVGVIRNTEVDVAGPNEFKAVTTIDHHFFDWQQDEVMGQKKLLVSPRGEGSFRTEWLVRKKKDTATAEDARKFAAPGKLAIVYGEPEKVDGDTVVLKYRYLRIVDNNYTTDRFNYGRFGEPFTWIGK